jgi:hypothetical protein
LYLGTPFPVNQPPRLFICGQFQSKIGSAVCNNLLCFICLGFSVYSGLFSLRAFDMGGVFTACHSIFSRLWPWAYAGFLYATYGWKGFLYNLSVILPGAFLCCIAILLATLEGMRYSRSLALHKVYAPGGKPIRTYITRFAGFLGFACVAAIVDTLMSALFGGFFSF